MKAILMFDNGRSIEFDSLVTVTVPKAHADVNLDMVDLPDVSIKWAFDYGWRQGLIDATAGVDPKEPDSADKAWTAVQKRIDNLKAGKIRASGGRVTDELTREALTIAAGDVRIAFKKAGKKLEPNAIAAEAKKRVENMPIYAELAQRAIDAREARLAEAEASVDELVGELTE